MHVNTDLVLALSGDAAKCPSLPASLTTDTRSFLQGFMIDRCLILFRIRHDKSGVLHLPV